MIDEGTTRIAGKHRGGVCPVCGDRILLRVNALVPHAKRRTEHTKRAELCAGSGSKPLPEKGTGWAGWLW